MSLMHVRGGAFDYDRVLNVSARHNPNVYTVSELKSIAIEMNVDRVPRRKADLVEVILAQRDHEIEELDLDRLVLENASVRNNNYRVSELKNIARNLGVYTTRLRTRSALVNSIRDTSFVRNLIQREEEAQLRAEVIEDLQRENVLEEQRLLRLEVERVRKEQEKQRAILREELSFKQYLDYFLEVPLDNYCLDERTITLNHMVDRERLINILGPYFTRYLIASDRMLSVTYTLPDDTTSVYNFNRMDVESFRHLLSPDFIETKANYNENTKLIAAIHDGRPLQFRVFKVKTKSKKQRNTKHNIVSKSKASGLVESSRRAGGGFMNKMNTTILPLAKYGIYSEIEFVKKRAKLFSDGSEVCVDEKLKKFYKTEDGRNNKDGLSSKVLFVNNCLFDSLEYLGVPMNDPALHEYKTLNTSSVSLPFIANNRGIILNVPTWGIRTEKCCCVCVCDCGGNCADKPLEERCECFNECPLYSKKSKIQGVIRHRPYLRSDPKFYGKKINHDCNCPQIECECEGKCMCPPLVCVNSCPILARGKKPRYNKVSMDYTGVRPVYKIGLIHGHYFPLVNIPDITEFAIKNYHEIVGKKNWNIAGSFSEKSGKIVKKSGKIGMSSFHLVKALIENDLLVPIPDHIIPTLELKPNVVEEYNDFDINEHRDFSKQSEVVSSYPIGNQCEFARLCAFDIETIRDSDKNHTHETISIEVKYREYKSCNKNSSYICANKAEIKGMHKPAVPRSIMKPGDKKPTIVGTTHTYESRKTFVVGYNNRELGLEMMNWLNAEVNANYSDFPTQYYNYKGKICTYKPKILIVAHNITYDLLSIVKHVDVSQVIESGKKVKRMVFNFYGNNYYTLDSYALIPKMLSAFSEMFNLPIEKAPMPFPFYNKENIMNEEDLCKQPDVRYTTLRKFKKSFKDNKQRKRFEEWLLNKENISKFVKDPKYICGKLTNGQFRYMKYCIYYNKIDVDLLMDGIESFRYLAYQLPIHLKTASECEEQLGYLDPTLDDSIKDLKEQDVQLELFDFISISSLAHHYFKANGCFLGCALLSGELQLYFKKGQVGGRTMTSLSMTNDNDIDSNPHVMWEVMSKIISLDVNSLYPDAMSKMSGYVRGHPKVIPAHMSLEELKKKDYYVCEIKVTDYGCKRQFPLISYKNDEGVRNFTNEIIHNTYFTDKTQIEDCEEFQGIKYHVVSGFYFDQGFNTTVCDLVTELYLERQKYKKLGNPIQEVIKLVLNSSYGKLSQKPILKKAKLVAHDKLEDYIMENPSNWISYKCIDDREGQYLFDTVVKMGTQDNFTQLGCQVLSYSKRIMNRMMCLAEDLGIQIYYQDTDSCHLEFSNVPKLCSAYKEKYGVELMGKNLGFFSNDFDGIDSARSHYSLFLGKKMYYEEVWDDGKLMKHVCKMKGVPTKQISLYKNPKIIYQRLYRGEPVKFNLLDGSISFFSHMCTDKDSKLFGKPVFKEPEMNPHYLGKPSFRRRDNYTFYSVDDFQRIVSVHKNSFIGKKRTIPTSQQPPCGYTSSLISYFKNKGWDLPEEEETKNGGWKQLNTELSNIH